MFFGFLVKFLFILGVGFGVWILIYFFINNVLGVYDGEEFIDDGEYMYGWMVSIYMRGGLVLFI